MTTNTRFLRDTVMNMISSSHSLRVALSRTLAAVDRGRSTGSRLLSTELSLKELEDKLFFTWRRAWTEDELDTETLWKMAHLVANKGTLHDMAWQNADAITLELDPSFVPTRLPIN